MKYDIETQAAILYANLSDIDRLKLITDMLEFMIDAEIIGVNDDGQFYFTNSGESLVEHYAD